MKNWKTTMLGIVTIAAALLPAAEHALRGQPVDWLTVGAGISAGWGLIHAADSKPTPPTQ